jgi:hypothetical protein
LPSGVSGVSGVVEYKAKSYSTSFDRVVLNVSLFLSARAKKEEKRISSR